MSIICRNTEDGVIRLFCKGADSVIMDRMKQGNEQNNLSILFIYLFYLL